MTTVLGNIKVNSIRAREAASVGYLNATDLADYLVRRGLEFRNAHELVGRIVTYANGKQNKLEDLSLDEYASFSQLISEDVYGALSLESSLSTKSAEGGTAPDRVRDALIRAKLELAME